MTTKPIKADEDLDALEALASEEKEFNKVCTATRVTIHTNSYRMQK